MSDAVDAVLAQVRERVTPDAAERERMAAVVAEVTDRAEAAVADLPVEAEVVHAGSTARDTWLAGDRDVDVFVAFPPDLGREDLETYGLEVGHAVLPAGHEEFAEHPYVVGAVEGFEVDLVPCYRVASATEIQSAVDRTPFHTRYLAERLDAERAGDVRVLKQLLSAVGAYGSDLRTRGFSGYLVELLVLAYGGARAVLEAAADWTPPVVLDPADHGTATFEDPLVVVDPTDPERNVAAVTSARNVARLQHHARRVLAEPALDQFEPREPEPLPAGAVVEAFEERGTTPLAVRVRVPPLVDDELWPQLERSLAGVGGELDRRGFEVLRSAVFATGRAAGAGPESERTAALLWELAVAERPAIERHEGPPVAVREHAERFLATEREGPVYGPFVDGDRYVIEREREFERAATFLASEAVFDVALGQAVAAAMREEYDVLVGSGVGDLAADFGVDLARYVDPKP